ncbi:MAG: sensor histidine kinase [Ruminococcaceae bacterium]|nr:sensor histidine kinase [Oscillospiraceae bacterium]
MRCKMKRLKVLTSKLNSFTLFQKMTIIYVTCIIIPLISIFMFYYGATVEKVKADNVEDVRIQTENVVDEIKNEFYQFMTWTSSLYLDENLYELLNSNLTTYSKGKALLDYINNSLNRSFLLNNSYAEAKIYSDNQTLYSGENLLRITDDTRKQEWYIKHKESGSNVSLQTSELILADGVNSKQYFSIVRTMDCYPTDHESLIKIDVEVDYFKKVFKSIYTGSKMCLLDENNRIIVSSNVDLKEYSKNDDWIELDLKLADSTDWKIVGYIDEAAIEGIDAKNFFFLLGIIFCIIAVTLFVIFAVSLSMTRRFTKITQCMNNIENHIFEPIDEEGVGKDEIAQLVYSTNRLTLKLKRLIEEVYEAEIKQKEAELGKQNAELKALQSQINPHFLFNTLETIRMRSLSRNEKETAGIIKNLSKMFRRMISWGEDIIDLKTELEYISEYLEIQKYRFGDELDIVMDIDENCLSCQLPKMVFQVFVENACLHGTERVSGKKHIALQAKQEDGMLVLSVTDNGMGMTEEIKRAIIEGKATQKERVGTSNAVRRLNYYYDDRYSLDIMSKCGQTKILLRIPHENKDGEQLK